MIPGEIIRLAEEVLSAREGRPVKISRTSSVGGGCINYSYCLETGGSNYFLKWNEASKYPGMFDAEEKGLQLLKGAGVISVPEVIRTTSAGRDAFILMEWLEPGRRKASFW